MSDILNQMWEHAVSNPTEEVCGLIISNTQKSRVLRGQNVSDKRFFEFDMSPDVWLEVPEGWEVVGTYHSHPTGIVTPSDADLTMCEVSKMPMHIVCGQNHAHQMIEPSGYKAPYLKRTYVWGLQDCYTLIRDWYNWEFGIDFGEWTYEREFWLKGQNLYVDRFEACGFVEVKDMPVCHGDVFLLQVGASLPNHAVIWLDSGRILHHVVGRVSKEDHWTGYWVGHATHHLRHKTRL